MRLNEEAGKLNQPRKGKKMEITIIPPTTTNYVTAHTQTEHDHMNEWQRNMMILK